MRDTVQRLLCESRRLVEAAGEARDDTLAGAGVTPIERCLVEALAREDAPVTVAMLARRRLTPVADITRGLDRLDSRGWIDRRGDHRQSSSEVVRLNDAGRAAQRALQANERALLVQLGAVLDERSARAALATLRQLRRTLQRAAIPAAPLTQLDHARTSGHDC